MAKKPRTLYGLWETLVDRFGEHAIAQSLDCTVAELNLMASNRIPVPPVMASLMHDFCDLHGIHPQLYIYADWKHPNNVVIADGPEGWMAWSLASEPGWKAHSRWMGHPSELKPIGDEYLLAEARRKAWPY
jgi:hypothetical protein